MCKHLCIDRTLKEKNVVLPVSDLVLMSSIRVTALLIKYVQLPACPATLIYSTAKFSGSGYSKSD